MIAETTKGQISFAVWKIGLAAVAGFVVLIGLAAFTGVAAQEKPGIRASTLMDHPVLDARGEEILEIDDLILRRSGNVKRVILSCCGFLGLGGKTVAVPFRRLQFKEDEIVYDVTEEEFKQMAEFDYAEEELYTGYYSYRPRARDPRAQKRSYPRYPYVSPYGIGPGYCPWDWSYSPASLLSSAVLNRPVVNMQCQQIGLVDDLMISAEGSVNHIILSVLLVDSDKDRVAVPYKPFKVTNWGLAYDISIEELRALPEFHF
ncbi:MAG: PRC-barrel domain-containing protein [Thermodesulfobacteriota bacterium]